MVAVKSRRSHRESPVECYHGDSSRFAANHRGCHVGTNAVMGDLGKNRGPVVYNRTTGLKPSVS
ncbi:hypothetical protein DPMN_080972 [Dreissena polymorpha]|uniref:Uncharacterized protein n=1 Tax=Dreissena polymorpha TaxID=45954 RepID=A0A9D3Y7T0_DREPO|nr:hypothetical protein DPMN_080972 [Dreissena polymorpha]